MSYNLCIIKPNKAVYSETFIQNHIDYLDGNKFVLYGGAFPIYDQNGNYLIESKFNLLLYLFQKRVLRKTNISVRDKALTKYLLKNDIQVVLAEYGMVGASVYKACEKANVPLVIHFHGADAHHQPTVDKYLEAYKLAFKYASKIVVVSKFMMDALLEMGAPLNKIALNPYGVDTDKFTIVNVEESKPVLFFAGRFVEKKAPLTLIKAFFIAKKACKEAKLIMAGEGPLLNTSKELVKELILENDIQFVGILTHKEVLNQMKTVRAFVQHSIVASNGDSEGTPNSILEASACGLPVVATKHAGINEAIVDQVSGLLSDEHDVDCFAANMIKVLKDKNLAQELGKQGAKYIRENYTLNFRISKLNQIIKKSIIQND